MASMTFDLSVEMEDGSTFDVRADQRDVARWELEKFGCPVTEIESRMMTFLRFVGWNAGYRNGLTTLSYKDFDAQCVEVADVSPDEEDDDAENPGRPAASATPS
jgi:hypothetical protein